MLAILETVFVCALSEPGYRSPMVRVELDNWARDFAANHGWDDVTVPFDRVVLRHLTRIEAFLDRGLTFAVLAKAITRAGVQRKDGRAYSDKQLNTAVRRARSQAKVRAQSTRPRPIPTSKPRVPSEGVTQQLDQPVGSTPVAQPTLPFTESLPRLPAGRETRSANDHDQDLSDEDIRAARQRIRRTDP